jgi:hypothetical protein
MMHLMTFYPCRIITLALSRRVRSWRHSGYHVLGLDRSAITRFVPTCTVFETRSRRTEKNEMNKMMLVVYQQVMQV